MKSTACMKPPAAQQKVPKSDTMKDNAVQANVEVLGNIHGMMKGFLDHLSRALKAASGSANHGKPNNSLQTKPPMVKVVIEQESEHTMSWEEKVELNYADKLNNLNPPTFDGLAGPKAAQDWLCEIDKCLDEIKVPLRIRVKIASLKLTDHAHSWFQTLKKITDGKKWHKFEKLFLNKFLPGTYRKCKKDVSFRLIQKDMRIEEYQSCFEEFHYDQDLNASDTDKMERFYNGLHLYYRQHIGGFNRFNSYKELVEFLIMFDNQSGQRRNLDEAEQNRFGKRVGDNNEGGSRKKKKMKLRDYLELGCFSCGSQEHMASSCPVQKNQVGGPRLGCFRCQSQEHFLKNCPLRQNQGRRGQTSHFEGRGRKLKY